MVEVDEAVYETYRRLDMNMTTDDISVNEEEVIVIRENHGELLQLGNIERFVTQISTTSDLAFDIQLTRSGVDQLRRKTLAGWYERLPNMLQMYSAKYVYSPRVAIFFECYKRLKLLSIEFGIASPMEVEPQSKWRFADWFNELIQTIRLECAKPRFTELLRKHARNVQRRTARALLWEREIFAWRSRHLMVMLTLNYSEEHRSEITPEIVQQHLAQLLNNRRMNTLLKGIIAYVWKLEEGEKSGLHVHMLIAYSASRKGDITVGRQIGEYWQNVVTLGKGLYRNSNREQSPHLRYLYGTGLGQVNHNDMEKRTALRRIIVYLTKGDQYLKRRTSTKFRTFGTSQVPEKIRLGRPRSAS